MTRLSSRYGLALVTLLSLSALARVAWIHDARGPDVCRSPEAIKATSLIPGTIALGERLEALDADTFQWSEGELANPLSPRSPMQFQIVRSYDAPRLYGNPMRIGERTGPNAHEELASAGSRPDRMQPEDLRVRELAVDGDRVPVHVAWDHTQAPHGPSRLVAWMFVYENRPVRSPLLGQLAGAAPLVVGGPRPLTLVTISAVAPRSTSDQAENAAMAWLADAWRYIARSCAP
ncbi:MAG TPA: hypothetical protein VFT98_00655 [Myxococcota bacterium]|nr:hypothetical protein [Myxococcota bacterium]